jgi:hypothetical protein
VYLTADSTLASAATNVARDGNHVMVSGAWTPTLLLEGAGTNEEEDSEDSASWTNGNSNDTVNDAVAPDGTATADLLYDDDTAASNHLIYSDPSGSFTASVDSCISVYLKSDGRDWAAIGWRDKTGAATKLAYFDLSTGAVGTSTTNDEGIVDVGGGWYRCWIAAPNNTGATAPRWYVYLAEADADILYDGNSASGLGIHMWGVQVEDNQSYPSSYLKTSAGTASRTADSFYFDWPHPPQAMTVYAKWVERGTLASSGKVLHVGSATAATDPRLVIESTGTFYWIRHDNGASTSTATLGVAPSIGDTVEIAGQLNADGSVAIYQSINGAAATTASDATVATPGPTWADTRLYLNSAGTSSIGNAEFIELKVLPGVHSMGTCRAI